MKLRNFYAALFSVALLTFVGSRVATAADQTYTGKVSDAMCGAHHEMAGGDASCTRTCVKGGSKYALVVGDKVYTLETSDHAALDKLNELAGASAKVTGEAKGDTIAVKSVASGS
jgi:hypothetical protein